MKQKKLNKTKVVFVIVQFITTIISVQQMLTTTGWIYNILIPLPLINLVAFAIRKDIKYLFFEGGLKNVYSNN